MPGGPFAPHEMLAIPGDLSNKFCVGNGRIVMSSNPKLLTKHRGVSSMSGILGFSIFSALPVTDRLGEDRARIPEPTMAWGPLH